MAGDDKKGFETLEYPKKSGVKIRPIFNAHDGDFFGASFLVTIPSKLTGGLRERKQFKGLVEAKKWADDIYSGYRKQGHDFFTLSAQERQEVGACIPLLRQHGISITEAVRFATKHIRPEGKTKSLRAVIEELKQSKQQRMERGDLRSRSFADFDQRAERLVKDFEGRIASEVTTDEIKKWLRDLEVGPRSTKNYLAVIGEIFKLATQRRYVAFSPLDSLSDIDRKDLCGLASETKEPSILTPKEAEKLLMAALEHPELVLLGAVTLGLFCGLRTEELKRLTWADVRWDEDVPVVTIGAKIAKKRRIRHVDIPKNALLWLSLVPKRDGPVTSNLSYNDHQQRFKKLLKLSKFRKWEANAMRHSFGSYHYSLHGNPLETSRLLGHKASDQVLFDHYRALASKEQAKQFFEITPPAGAGNFVRFSA